MHRNTNALHGVTCPKCGHIDSFEITVQARAVIIDNGADTYFDPEWGDASETTCKNCGYTAAFTEFKASGSWSRCRLCQRLIRWDGQQWFDDDGQSSCPDHPAGDSGLTMGHRPRWLTLGELRDRTAHLPDDMPVTAHSMEVAGPGVSRDSWENLRLEDVPDKYDPTTGAPSLILETAVDFDAQDFDRW